jgi:soluble lytic murein transglycosylase-like protein
MRPRGDQTSRREAPNPRRNERDASNDAPRRAESNATNFSEAGERMGRTRVATLIVLSLLVISGARVEQAAPPVSAAGPVVATASADFDEAQLRHFLGRESTALSPNEIRRIAAAVIRYSAQYGLDPILVTQVLWVESRARPWVRSPLGAVGLMQVMPHMAAELNLTGNLAAIETNIEAGCWILADNIRRLGEEDGISAYFWGSDIRSVAYLNRVKKARAAVRGASES